MEPNAAQRLGSRQQSGSGLSTIRLVVTVFIIVACFSALYPKFFHPIVLRMFGVSQPKQKTEIPTHPPHRPMPHGGDPRQDDIKKHIRPGPHPGMRAAAEMNKNKQGSSGRGGMMGMILPVYAFGIIGYLIYTLVKVFGKKDKDGGSIYGRRRGPYDRQVGEENNRQPQQQQQQQEDEDNKLKGLEDLLSRASNVDPTISADEMRELQKRLEETEKQMTQILSAMQQVSSKVNTVAADTAKPESEDKPNSSNDSSPDISSYEVVDKTKEKNSPEKETEKASEKNSSEVETMTPSETANKQTDSTIVEEDKKMDGNSIDDEEIKDTEEILEDKKEEEESGVRHRKGHPESSN